MDDDIFSFWSVMKAGDRVHPDDRAVLERLPEHGFDLNLLPTPFNGPLRTAKVVLLYPAPGRSVGDEKEAASDQGQKRALKQYGGNEPLFEPDQQAEGHKWLASRLKFLGVSWPQLRTRVAVLEMAPYHSKNFSSKTPVIALPSARVAVGWAQRVLFPQAIRGERVVVGMRSHHHWGLARGSYSGEALFAPETTRHGHLLTGAHDPILEAIHSALGN